MATMRWNSLICNNFLHFQEKWFKFHACITIICITDEFEFWLSVIHGFQDGLSMKFFDALKNFFERPSWKSLITFCKGPVSMSDCSSFMNCFQAAIDAAVNTLLSLKAEYKSATGKDWKPGAHVSSSVAQSSGSTGNQYSVDDLNEKITAQGNKVRELKGSKAPKVIMFNSLPHNAAFWRTKDI